MVHSKIKIAKIDANILLLVVSIAAGLVFGVLRPLFLDEYDFAALIDALRNFTAGFVLSPPGVENLAESLLRYGRPWLLIWACAAIPKVRFASYLVIYLRAVALGFSAVMMVAAFGGRGFIMAMALYGLQNMIIMPIYGCTVHFIVKNPASPAMAKKAIVLAVAGAVAVVLAALVEVYISPVLFLML